MVEESKSREVEESGGRRWDGGEWSGGESEGKKASQRVVKSKVKSREGSLLTFRVIRVFRG